MKAGRIVLIVLLVIGLGVGAYFAYQYYRNSQASTTAIYQTVAVRRGDLKATIGATGTVRANQSATLNWVTNGTVGMVKVEAGALVHSGDILAILDATSLPQTMILAKADLVTAQRNLDNLRTSELAKAQAQKNLVVTQKAFNDAESKRKSLDYGRASREQLDNARAAYLIAEEEVKKLQIYYDRSPPAGRHSYSSAG